MNPTCFILAWCTGINIYSICIVFDCRQITNKVVLSNIKTQEEMDEIIPKKNIKQDCHIFNFLTLKFREEKIWLKPKVSVSI